MKIQLLRKKIDQLDSRLLKLLNQRAKLSSAIGQCKLASGSHVYAPDREEHLLRKLEGKNRGPMPRAALRFIYREILSTSRACQSPLKIACLGHELSNAWVATRRRFGSSDHYHPVPALQQVITGLSRGTIDIGVVDREALAEYLWEKNRRATGFAVCGDVLLPSDRAKKGSSGRDIYFLLSRQAVPPAAFSKTVLLMECVSSVKTVKDWRSAFPVLTKKLLHVERIQWGGNRTKNRWLVDMKGHWENEALAAMLEPRTKMIHRWLLVGSYPEVPSYA